MKKYIAHTIKSYLKDKKLSQKESAELLGTNQPRISQLFTEKLEMISVDCLIQWADKLGFDPKIVLTVPTRATVVRITGVGVDPKTYTFRHNGDELTKFSIDELTIGDLAIYIQIHDQSSVDSTYLRKATKFFPESRVYGTVGVDTYDLIEEGDDATREYNEQIYTGM